MMLVEFLTTTLIRKEAIQAFYALQYYFYFVNSYLNECEMS